jgi:cellulose biosynthesis protein BcsQ
MIAAAGLPVLDTVIPMYARLATSYGMGPIVFTAPNSREAQAVRDAMGELIIKLDKSESGAA